MRILTLIAVCLTILLQPAAGEDKPVPPAVAAKLSLVEAFKQRNPETLAILEADFPDDARALFEQLALIESTGQSEMVLLNAGFDVLSAIRHKYAGRLLYAPPKALAGLLGSLAAFYDDVLKREGTGVCGKFAQDGSVVLFRLAKSSDYVARLDAQSAAYFEAVVQAIEAPENYGEPGKEDWGKVLGTMVGQGAPQSYVISIAAGNAADPNLCPALAAMFRTVAALDTPEGLRTRADFAKNLAGY